MGCSIMKRAFEDHVREGGILPTPPAKCYIKNTTIQRRQGVGSAGEWEDVPLLTRIHGAVA